MQEHYLTDPRPVILVTGATGAQGGSVARALLDSGRYIVRCLTRNSHSHKALALRLSGAEVVEGDLTNTDSLLAAMKDCYGVFGVTNFWEHYENEFQQGKNLIDAVKASGIQHFIYSGLPGYLELTGGQFPVPHCDIKAALENYTRSLALPASFVHIAFYYENFFSFFPPRRRDDGCYYFGFPQGDTRLAMVSVDDLGAIVARMFAAPEIYLHRTVGAVGEDRPCREYAAIMSRVLGVTVRYQHIQRDIYSGLDFPGAEELANMFETQRLFIPNRNLHLMESHCMNPRMQSLENWLIKNKRNFLQLLNEPEYV